MQSVIYFPTWNMKQTIIEGEKKQNKTKKERKETKKQTQK